jgi:DNA-binding CsgD family transcriptional regulator
VAARKQKPQKKRMSARLVEDEDYQLRHEKVAGIDIAKASGMVCLRLPGRRSVPAPDGVPADPECRTRYRGRRRGRGRGIRGQHGIGPAPRRGADGRPDAGHGRDRRDDLDHRRRPGEQDPHPDHLRPGPVRVRRAKGGPQRLPPERHRARRAAHRHPRRRRRRRGPRPDRDTTAHPPVRPLLPDPGRQQDRDALLGKLRDREQTVFFELAVGRSNREIAARLHLSEGTVKIHVGRILAKLGLRDRVQAVVMAYESGLITPGS